MTICWWCLVLLVWCPYISSAEAQVVETIALCLFPWFPMKSPDATLAPSLKRFENCCTSNLMCGFTLCCCSGSDSWQLAHTSKPESWSWPVSHDYCQVLLQVGCKYEVLLLSLQKYQVHVAALASVQEIEKKIAMMNSINNKAAAT